MNKREWNINEKSYISIQEIAFENVCQITAILSRPHCVNMAVLKETVVSEMVQWSLKQSKVITC